MLLVSPFCLLQRGCSKQQDVGQHSVPQFAQRAPEAAGWECCGEVLVCPGAVVWPEPPGHVVLALCHEQQQSLQVFLG